MVLANFARSSLVRVVVVTVRQVGVDPHGLEPAFELRGEVGDDVALGDAVDGPAGVAAAVARIEDDRLAGQRRAGAAQLLGLAQLVRPPADDGALQLLELAQGHRPAAAVVHQAALVLELPKRGLGALAEDPVAATDVEAQVSEPLLQLLHVVAGERVADAAVEVALPEPLPRLLERLLGGRADDPVDEQPAGLLQPPDGLVDVVVELVRSACGGRIEQPELDQLQAQVLDGRPGGPTAKEWHGVGEVPPKSAPVWRTVVERWRGVSPNGVSLATDTRPRGREASGTATRRWRFD